VKLQIKLLLLVIGILIVIGIISGGMMLYFQRRASADQFEHMAMALAGAVQGPLERDMLIGELRHTQEAMVRIRQEEMVSEVVLFSPDGVIAASSEVAEIGEIDDTDEIRRVLQSGEASMRTERQNNQSELWVSTPVFNRPECQRCHNPETKVLGAIKVSLDATSLDNQARQQTMFFGIFGALTLFIIGGGLAFALKKTVLNPLSSLTKSTQRLSQGDYTTRAISDKKDEIGMLAQTFNEMAESVEQRSRELEASRQELARWNVDLEDKIQRRTGELSALNAVVTTISQSLNLDRILNDALNKTLTVMEIEAGAVHLLSEKADRLIIMVHQGLSPEYVQEVTKLKLGEHIVGRAVQSGKPVVVNDVMDSAEAAIMEGERREFRAYISVPVRSKNEVLGALTLASHTPGKFDPETVHLLSAMGDAIGIAVENARAAQRLEEVNKIREQLLEKLISAQEEERRRIARELHDEASQSLAALAINLEGVADTLPPTFRDTKQKLDALKERAIQTAGGIRNLALELRPSALDDLGLFMAIDWYAKDYLAKRGLDVKIEVIKPETKLPSYTETMLFRIIQEALTNIVKHAGASKVRVQLQLSDSTAIVEVEDDGKGFDVEVALSRKGVRQNLGLHGMAERATLLGGTFNIRSQPGQGTCLRVEIPLMEKDVPNE
jgi:signal transduction histidine kinase